MPTLAVIDDRKDIRETLARNIEADLPKNWSVLASDPLPSMSDYASWITENGVVAIILDERLQEQIADRKIEVDYAGHDLAKHLRGSWPTLPIFMVTTHPEDSALKDTDNEVLFEEIFNREEFYNRSAIYIKRIVRAAQRFFDTFQKQLTTLGTCASKIASGRGTDKDKKILIALQTSLNGAFPSVTENAAHAATLTDLQDAVVRLEEVAKRAKQLTKKGTSAK